MNDKQLWQGIRLRFMYAPLEGLQFALLVLGHMWYNVFVEALRRVPYFDQRFIELRGRKRDLAWIFGHIIGTVVGLLALVFLGMLAQFVWLFTGRLFS